MKALLAILTLTIGFSAQASWMGIKCSNSDGTVKWETGFQEDKVRLQYSNFIEGTLELGPEQVIMNFGKEVVIREKQIKECQYAGMIKVTASRVRISASDKNPDVLRSYFPENKVVTEVICTKVMTNTLPCENN